MLARQLARNADWHEPEPKINADGIDIGAVSTMSEDEAFAEIVRRRWADGPSCPKCGANSPYALRNRRMFTCRGCKHQFTPTSGTPYQSHKVGYRDLLLIMAKAAGRIKESGIVNQKSSVESERRRMVNNADWSERCSHGQVTAECVDCKHDRIVADYERGIPGYKIGELHGLKPTAIYEVLRKRRVPRVRR